MSETPRRRPRNLAEMEEDLPKISRALTERVEERHIEHDDGRTEYLAKKGESIGFGFESVTFEQAADNGYVALDVRRSYKSAEKGAGSAVGMLDHLDLRKTARSFLEIYDREKSLPDDEKTFLAPPPTLAELQAEGATLLVFDGAARQYHVLKEGEEQEINGAKYTVYDSMLELTPINDDETLHAETGLRLKDDEVEPEEETEEITSEAKESTPPSVKEEGEEEERSKFVSTLQDGGIVKFANGLQASFAYISGDEVILAPIDEPEWVKKKQRLNYKVDDLMSMATIEGGVATVSGTKKEDATDDGDGTDSTTATPVIIPRGNEWEDADKKRTPELAPEEQKLKEQLDDALTQANGSRVQITYMNRGQVHTGEVVDYREDNGSLHVILKGGTDLYGAALLDVERVFWKPEGDDPNEVPTEGEVGETEPPIPNEVRIELQRGDELSQVNRIVDIAHRIVTGKDKAGMLTDEPYGVAAWIVNEFGSLDSVLEITKGVLHRLGKNEDEINDLISRGKEKYPLLEPRLR